MINENTSSSSWLIDSYDIWHARLIHVNPMYVMKLRRLGLINMHDKQIKKFETRVESKLTKKTCPFVQRETDVVDLKQTMMDEVLNFYRGN